MLGDADDDMICTCGGLNVSTKFGSTKDLSRCIPLCLEVVFPPDPVFPDPVDPILLLSFCGFKFVKEGLLPCVGPVPGIGRRLRGGPLDEAAVGCGIPLPPRLGVFGAAPLMEEEYVSLRARCHSLIN